MKKRLFCLILAAVFAVNLLPTVILAADLSFTDVPKDAWYYEDVKTACGGGLVNGKTETTFCPDDDLTYAEAVKLAACMHQKAAEGAVSLKNGDPWYQTYVDYAKENGIITRDFDWNASATRTGYISIFAHALPDSLLAAVNEVPDGSIPDVPMNHAQAAEIYKLYRAGVLEGSDDMYNGSWTSHLCKPSDCIRRSEVAAVLTRMMVKEERKSFVMTSWRAQYIRTDGYHDGVNYPVVTLIDNADDLNRYFEDNKNLYDLSHRETVYSDTSIGFEDAVKGYDAAWFRTHQLILVLVEAGSGSIRYDVTDVSLDSEPSVEIAVLVPYVMTDDMAEWHILIEIEKTLDPSAEIKANLSAKYADGYEIDTDQRSDSEKMTDFALRLLRRSIETEEGKNTLVSPLSVFGALAMTANGAKGDTLSEMEAVLGMNMDEVNAYFKALLDNLPKDQADSLRFHLANSVWFIDDDSFAVNDEFLHKNADFYDADVFRAAFDEETLKEINDWVKENTDGMIPAILDKIPEEAVMYLVNALAFEGEWIEPYKEHLVNPGTFTRENGTKTTVDFMWSGEHSYLEGEGAVGFVKYYKGGKAAFAALLPKEGTTVSDLLASLDGEGLIGILSSARSTRVDTALPKFETSTDLELSDILSAMGMPMAFDMGAADFTGLGTSTAGNIYISRVLHKTFISVAEQGTKAGAATAVELAAKSAMPQEEPKRVILDRPFVYMLIDCETNVPFFIGTFMAE